MCAVQLCTFIAQGLGTDSHALSLSSYTVLCRGVGQASNKLGLGPAIITSLYKPWEVQKPPGETYRETKSNPSLERGFRHYGSLKLTRSNQPLRKRNALSVCPLAPLSLKY